MVLNRRTVAVASVEITAPYVAQFSRSDGDTAALYDVLGQAIASACRA
ncbi:hypothetical protein [Pseudonocardia kunmingensis]|uniref:Uncharacterized protein n=1 Tax=Pseudonocardia kunmingensis TaxID=630975 RepID=A0A543DVD5_9PSEU|nr:hypothetical protein [Pseudonocardia kunmingensis]TQM13287.1 hypothetical protein FB558_0018 [Pseudonocardia kunmingensis]